MMLFLEEKNTFNIFFQEQNNNLWLYQVMLYIKINHSIMPELLTWYYLFNFKSSQKNIYFSKQYVSFKLCLYFFIILKVRYQFMIAFLIIFDNFLE